MKNLSKIKSYDKTHIVIVQRYRKIHKFWISDIILIIVLKNKTQQQFLHLHFLFYKNPLKLYKIKFTIFRYLIDMVDSCYFRALALPPSNYYY